MAHHTARSSTTDSASYMQSPGRGKSPTRRAGSPTLRPGSPVMASMAAVTVNTARTHAFRSLSPECRVDNHLIFGMSEAARQARGPKSILHRLLAFQTGQHGGRLDLTREEVSNTVASILGTAKVAAHEFLSVGVTLLEFVPIPGLASIGETLLGILEALQEVHANRHACEQLVERCAVIVSFVQEEVCKKNRRVPDELKPSVARLDKALREVETFIREQALQGRAYEFMFRNNIKRRIEDIQFHLTQAFQYLSYAAPIQILHFLQREIHPASENHNAEIIAPPTMVIITPPPQPPHEPRQPPQAAPLTAREPAILEFPTCTSPEGVGIAHTIRTTGTAQPTIVRVDRGPCIGNVSRPNNGHAPSAPIAAPPRTGNRQLDIPRLYARLVQHDFDESLLLTMPLWTPTPIHIGAVGYYSRADGGFVTLFNAHAPLDIAGVPALSQYGSVEAYQPKPMSYMERPHTFALQADSPAAYLYTEKTMYRCFKDLQGPETWLLKNADQVIAFFRGQQHPIDRKRLMLVTGTMAAQDHALCVCPNPPRSNGTIAFHRRKGKPGQPWGEWSQKPGNGAEPVVSKVSMVKAAHEPWDAVFLSVLSYHRLVDEVAQ